MILVINMKKAVLVGVTTRKDQYDINYSINELTSLADTLGIFSCHVITQQLNSPNAAFYVGKGKVDEIKLAVSTYDADVVIFNDELSPAQLRNLNEAIDVEIIDRSLLILNIFAERIQTREAKLEIDLARNMYLYPRVSSLREKESRSGGSSGGLSSKGSGETQKELDKRRISKTIDHIKLELDEIQRMKSNQITKRKRNEVPIVALVGYTNAGKSSTMNTILNYINPINDKNVYEKNELFATLSTHNRQVTYKKTDFILTDTIGFVSKLPTHLIRSFRQTLEEIKNADLIIHVVDISSMYYREQMEITNQVLANLECQDIKTLYLLNKYDLYDDCNTEIIGVVNMPFSNKTKLNVLKLLDYIVEEIKPRSFELKVLIPYKEGKLVKVIEEKAKILNKEYRDNGVYYEIEINQIYYKELSLYEIDRNIS